MTVLMALACIVAGVWGFALLADEVIEGGTQAFDQKLLLAFRHSDTRLSLGPPSVQQAARDITALGGVAVLTLITAPPALREERRGPFGDREARLIPATRVTTSGGGRGRRTGSVPDPR